MIEDNLKGVAKGERIGGKNRKGKAQAKNKGSGIDEDKKPNGMQIPTILSLDGGLMPGLKMNTEMGTKQYHLGGYWYLILIGDLWNLGYFIAVLDVKGGEEITILQKRKEEKE
ncbi:hypothetical protein Clacol_004374 [Clathrus columnatus]|uniref:Uncharacterized protein n=1 Tax=Clathrus columnatus TaxID=1419009 RepID=A0AAV5AAD6_9AGAM|nr:hypothetical protein Clacol_004374 [Clathrus columnatus]